MQAGSPIWLEATHNGTIAWSPAEAPAAAAAVKAQSAGWATGPTAAGAMWALLAGAVAVLMA